MYKITALIDKNEIDKIALIDEHYKVLNKIMDKVVIMFNVVPVMDQVYTKSLLWEMIPSISFDSIVYEGDDMK